MSPTLRMALISTALAATTLGSASYAGGSVPLFDLGYDLETVTIANLKAMEGKRVLGKKRELIGHIGTVDEQAKLVELKTSERAIVSISTDFVGQSRRHVGGRLAFARRYPRHDRQTGRTIDTRSVSLTDTLTQQRPASRLQTGYNDSGNISAHRSQTNAPRSGRKPISSILIV
jgi:hypothetical protein